MTDVSTHLGIDRRLCGEPVELGAGSAVVELVPSREMAADERGLVHGGFVFGMADYAAMLAVNHPNVVLAGADVKFKAPVVVGERIRASARVTASEGKRATVEVEVTRDATLVFTGTFHTATPSGHVLDKRG
jgi:acyl-coenzyme A thioesterase PaaI-like protein